MPEQMEFRYFAKDLSESEKVVEEASEAEKNGEPWPEEKIIAAASEIRQLGLNAIGETKEELVKTGHKPTTSEASAEKTKYDEYRKLYTALLDILSSRKKARGTNTS
ncbi:MAG TPA: hypothetical protein VMC43_02500 [Candidatus Paceibacterota bacterium]|nr:hypothetical protein [Candidatus Paceibacterota bacterium]